MLARREIIPTAATAKISGMDLDMSPMMTTRKNKNKKKRRFSDEQIRSLEFMFEAESRPEPRKQQQLANKLGLQPRQVAIWFQNRRARLKSKQIEREYNILKASYDTLASTFESLKKENQSLVTQLQAMRNLPGKTQGSTNRRFKQTKNSSNGECKNGDTESESKEIPGQNVEFFQEGTDILNMVEPTDGFLTSSGTWCSFESSFFLNQSSCSAQWWEF